MAFLFYVSILTIAAFLLGEDNIGEYEVWIIMAAGLLLALIVYLIICYFMTRTERRKAHKLWVMTKIQEAEITASELTVTNLDRLKSAEVKLTELNSISQNLPGQLHKAQDRFRERLFEPYWEQVASIYTEIESFDRNVMDLRYLSDSYQKSLVDKQHNFPPIVFSSSQIPDLTQSRSELLEIVKKGMSNIDFAKMLVLMDIRKAVNHGFNRLS